MTDFKLPPEIGWLITALFGGAAKFADNYLKGNHPFNWVKFALLLFVSGFSGYMTAAIMHVTNPTWEAVAAGAGGFAGTKILEVMIEAISLRFGIKKPETKEEVK